MGRLYQLLVFWEGLSMKSTESPFWRLWVGGAVVLTASYQECVGAALAGSSTRLFRIEKVRP